MLKCASLAYADKVVSAENKFIMDSAPSHLREEIIANKAALGRIAEMVEAAEFWCLVRDELIRHISSSSVSRYGPVINHCESYQS